MKATASILFAAAVFAAAVPAVAQTGPAAGGIGIRAIDFEALFPHAGWIVTPPFYPGDPVQCAATFHSADGSAFYVALADGTKIAEFTLPGAEPGEIRIFSVRVTPEWSAVARHQLQDGVAEVRPIGPGTAAALPAAGAAAARAGVGGPPIAGGLGGAAAAAALGPDVASRFVAALELCPAAAAPETATLTTLF